MKRHPLIGLAVKVLRARNGRERAERGMGMIRAVTPGGWYAQIDFATGRRGCQWWPILRLEGRTDFARDRIKEWIEARTEQQTEEMELIEGSVIEVMGEVGRRKIRAEEL